MGRMLPKTFFITALITLSVISIAWSAPPDAGQLLREQQPQRQLPTQMLKPELEKERPPMADSGVSVVVKSFQFRGYEGLATESELQELVADSVGKKLTFNDLQELADKITSHLRDKGWFLSRAYLPKQDVTSGNIEIAIIKGSSDGSLIIKRDPKARISEKVLQNIGETAVRTGQTLSLQKLERAVLLMCDLPNVKARASLAAGVTPGSTAVQVDVEEGPLFSGSVWGDNYGNRYTGTWRGNGMLSLNDPLRYGDQLYVLATGAEGIMLGKIAYAFPVAPCGLKGILSYTGMHYKLVGDMSDLKMDGWSHVVNAGLSYPVLRSRITNLTTTFGYEFKALSDFAFDIGIREKQLHSGTVGLNGDNYDTVLGGGYTTLNASFTIGTMRESIADIRITDTEGGYTHVNLGIARLQRIADRVTLNLSYSGQLLAYKNLDSSEKFILGGPNGVRAYPVGEAPGDEGSLFNFDLRYDLPLPSAWGSFQVSGFYDAGLITLHKNEWANSINTATNKNNYWLQGAGLGLLYAYKNIFSLKTSWAHVIGDNPGRSTTGLNSDGMDDQYRFWLLVTMYF